MKKTKYYFLGLLAFLFYACKIPCWEPTYVGEPEYPNNEPIKEVKYFTIINRSDKTYTNNGLYSLQPMKINSVWKLYYARYRLKVRYRKINIIKPGKNLTKDQTLELASASGCYSNDYYSWEKLFLLSLDGGKKKIFFGAYNYEYKGVWGEITSDCKKHFIKYHIHPVWQNKDLTITIQKDGKIIFNDLKIKEVKKIKLHVGYLNKLDGEIDLTTLPIISDCE